jgi:hypothetical protein
MAIPKRSHHHALGSAVRALTAAVMPLAFGQAG